MTDGRLYAPATLRNREPIAAVLADVLPACGTVLEIASGSGEHAIFFAHRFPGLLFQPSDPDADAVASIHAWRAGAALANLMTPIRLDATAVPWPMARADAIVCINMIHISPWAATEGLIRGSAACLGTGAPLYLYGPYRRSDFPTAASNEAFDTALRQSDPTWGLRDLEAVAALAASHGFGTPEVMDMPANNLSIVFRRT